MLDAIASNSSTSFPLPYRWLAATFAQLGNSEEATAMLQKAVALAPGQFDTYVRRRVVWMPRAGHAHLLDGLRKAGWRG